jgi:TonB family protein
LQRNVQLRIGMVHETITVIDDPSSPMPPMKPDLVAKLRAKAAEPQVCGDAGGCLAPPKKLADRKPVFPDSQMGTGGVVTLKGLIDATGHVANVQVVGDANPDLAQSAIAAVSQWEFQPTRLDGQVVETEIQISVTFKPTR